MAAKSDFQPLKGTCTCGAVTVVAPLAPVYACCSCGTCQGWAGHHWQGVPCQAGPGAHAPNVTGPLVFRRTSHKVERATCGLCLTPIYIHFTHSGRVELNRALFPTEATAAFVPKPRTTRLRDRLSLLAKKTLDRLIPAKLR